MKLTPAQQEVVTAALPLARRIARSIRRSPGLDLDDVLQMISEGFVEAALRYDPSREVPFERYARAHGRGKAMEGVANDVREIAPRQGPMRAHHLAAFDAALEAADEVEDVTDITREDDPTMGQLGAFCREATFRMLVGDVVMGLSTEAEDVFLKRCDGARRKLVLAEAIRALPEADRTILTLRHAEDVAWSEVASAVGLGEEAVRSRYRRVVSALRDALMGPSKG